MLHHLCPVTSVKECRHKAWKVFLHNIMMTDLAAPEYTIGRYLLAAEGNAIRLLTTGPGCVSDCKPMAQASLLHFE